MSVSSKYDNFSTNKDWNFEQEVQIAVGVTCDQAKF